MSREAAGKRYIAFDVETPNAANDRISAIGITVVENGALSGAFYSLVNPETHFDSFNIELTGITPEAAARAPSFPEVWKRIEPVMNSGTLVAHNAVFDLSVLKKCFQAYRIRWKTSTDYLCTVQIGRRLLPGVSHKLDSLCDFYDIDLNHHQADSDSRACAEILLRYMEGGRDLSKYRKTWLFGVNGPGAETAETARRTVRTDRTDSADAQEMYVGEVPCDRRAEEPRDADLRAGANRLSRPEEMLRRVYGHAEFREGQRQAVDSLIAGQDVLCVMPTGSGKSVCYQVPALCRSGTALVISPLISLMKDQVTALRGRGIASACLNSSLSGEEYAETAYRAACGEWKILYVAPERLQSPGFLDMCLHMDISLVAVDEAHCISQWGQDFRPSYLKIPEFIRMLEKRPPVGAFTATATPRVRQDILRHLELNDPVCVTTGYDRPNLSFSVYSPEDRDAALLELLRDRFRQSGIVYCATRKAVDSVTEMLTQAGFPAVRYHAGLDREERLHNQEDFLFDRKRVMVATNAFGMGIDKSNVSYVIHYNMPMSLEAYYQEAGRAGRDGGDADCILLYAGQDVMTARWLIEHGDPNPDLTPEEQATVRAQDEERLKWMTFYARSRRCLRGDILRYFGENPPEKCSNCSNCVPDCEHRDLTIEAQMILSCVARTGQRLAAEPLAALLHGAVPEGLPADLDPKKLTTFGLMAGESEERILETTGILVDQGLLETGADGRTLLLNDGSRAVLFRGQRVTVRRLHRRTAGGAGAEDLLQALQRLRYEISAEEYIAASNLFSDITLRDICRTLPRTKKQLAAVDGMGVFKAGRYGERIIALVEHYAPPKQAALKKTEADAAKDPSKKSPRAAGQPLSAYKEQLAGQGSTEAYQPWTKAEDDQLEQEFRDKVPLKVMADRHKRTCGAVRHRLKRQGLI